ncbi:hypothetical protein LR48_Vigan05g075100 [Vigna angularis]|uniref:Uncharacterized protein n=1 Tax=Phaseolus angularis TaxID=3914 RepID=A0A0L9UKQ1_PHAAN|nr:hypothetical protein LR48_Vigan05g075100 [Vigna angularis]
MKLKKWKTSGCRRVDRSVCVGGQRLNSPGVKDFRLDRSSCGFEVFRSPFRQRLSSPSVKDFHLDRSSYDFEVLVLLHQSESCRKQ